MEQYYYNIHLCHHNQHFHYTFYPPSLWMILSTQTLFLALKPGIHLLPHKVPSKQRWSNTLYSLRLCMEGFSPSDFVSNWLHLPIHRARSCHQVLQDTQLPWQKAWPRLQGSASPNPCALSRDDTISPAKERRQDRTGNISANGKVN